MFSSTMIKSPILVKNGLEFVIINGVWDELIYEQIFRYHIKFTFVSLDKDLHLITCTLDISLYQNKQKIQCQMWFGKMTKIANVP